MATKHKFKYQQAVRWKKDSKLYYIESIILNDKYDYQIRTHDKTDLWNVTEAELELVDKGDELLYGR